MEEFRRLKANKIWNRKTFKKLFKFGNLRIYITCNLRLKARREEKSEKRERHHQFEIEKRRRQEAHKASIATRKALNFYRDILGIEEDETTRN